MSEKSWSVDWVERATKRELNEGQARCVDVISSVDRPYNLQLINDGWSDSVDYGINLTPDYDINHEDGNDWPASPAVIFHPEFIVLRLRGTWSTFDCSRLTEVVLAAHAAHVRVQIASRIVVVDGWEDDTNRYFQSCTEVQLNARQASGDLYHSHPGRTDLAARAMEKLIERYPLPTPEVTG